MLIIEGGFDKAPKAIIDKMEIIRNCYKEIIKKHSNEADKKIINEKIENMPYSEMLDGFILATQYSLENITKEQLNEFTAEATFYGILSDNLEPILQKGSKFKLITIPLNRYKKGDILAYKKNGNVEYKKIIAFNDEEIILKNNKGYFEENFEEIEPLGIIDLSSVEIPN